MAMKRCKDCGAEISTGAKTCPKCGKDQKNFFQKHIFLTFILVIIIISSVTNISNKAKSSTSNSNLSASSQSQKINLEKFNKIENGMTYEEVVNIIGEEGTVISDVDIGSSAYKTTIYYWYSENGISNANITFQGGKVVAKAQIGLN